MSDWRDVVGYEGYYQVSRFGEVRSVDRVVVDSLGRVRNLKGRVLLCGIDTRTGHVSLVLCSSGKRTTFWVHRLVLEAWVGPCPDGCEVRHGPNGVSDNSVSNLSYGTHAENALDMRRDGTHGGRSVRRSDSVEFDSLTQASEASGCDYRNIWACCNGLRKTSGGYGWEYV